MQRSCIIEFDGASKGNPGQAGAGAVLRADDGSMVHGPAFGGLLGFFFSFSTLNVSNSAFCIDL